MRIFHLIGLVAAGVSALSIPVQAGESAVFENGFRLHADRHEVDGATMRLYADGGFTEIPATSIVRFEADDEIPPAGTAKNSGMAEAAAEVPVTPMELATAAAQKFSLPPSFVQSVMRAESGFKPAALSSKGAIGLMQLMPETARQLGVDPKLPKENAEGGAQYLRDLLAKYEKDPDQVLLALAAYNAGPGAVERYHGVPPDLETRQYILRVLKNWERQEPRK